MKVTKSKLRRIIRESIERLDPGIRRHFTGKETSIMPWWFEEYDFNRIVEIMYFSDIHPDDFRKMKPLLEELLQTSDQKLRQDIIFHEALEIYKDIYQTQERAGMIDTKK